MFNNKPPMPALYNIAQARAKIVRVKDNAAELYENDPLYDREDETQTHIERTMVKIVRGREYPVIMAMK